MFQYTCTGLTGRCTRAELMLVRNAEFSVAVLLLLLVGTDDQLTFMSDTDMMPVLTIHRYIQNKTPKLNPHPVFTSVAPWPLPNICSKHNVVFFNLFTVFKSCSITMSTSTSHSLFSDLHVLFHQSLFVHLNTTSKELCTQHRDNYN